MRGATFSARLRIALECEGVSQRELARLTGIDESNISHYISGERKPGADNIAAILKALPLTDARWLLGGYR